MFVSQNPNVRLQDTNIQLQDLNVQLQNTNVCFPGSQHLVKRSQCSVA